MLMFEDVGKAKEAEAKEEECPATAHPRCEAEKTLRGGYCELPGKVGLAGLLVCGRHAKQLKLQDRKDLLEGVVLSLELCLRNIPLRKNKGLSILLRAQHAQAARELAYALKDLSWATTHEEEEEEKQQR